MKFLDYIFSSIYRFGEALDDGRPGNAGMTIFATLYILTILPTLNILSFFTHDTIIVRTRIACTSAILSYCFFYLRYYYKKRYIIVIDQFKSKNNKDLYYFITVAYIIISIVVVFFITN
jgi:hypothetical protein